MLKKLKKVDWGGVICYGICFMLLVFVQAGVEQKIKKKTNKNKDPFYRY